MALEQLKVNDLIQILIPPGSIFSGHHKSRIEDMSDDKLILALPFKEGQPIPMHVKERVIFYKITDSGIWVYQTQVLSRKAHPIPVIEVDRPLKADKVQRRNFYRFPIVLETDYAKIDEQKDPIDWEWLSCSIRNISGGGLLLLCQEPLEKDNKLFVNIPLLQEQLRMKGIIRRVSKVQEQRETSYYIGLEFIEPTRVEQEKIIQFIFARQRERRNQEL
ncbi:hypothetical protein F9B85_09250 [Heliorestis acidaminivorans]|uniref:Flagellar brake protein n=1 Tax=Heliorestis acidaminivorans TaxID=553427 RepID=A0A6I0EQD5_9FIRM|nr:flagellar brake protein [Heliorestis acidaminivorans]KAB2952334.1 hypothetical protein F9B85_09250 [Heliorestis acidaminivorans]